MFSESLSQFIKWKIKSLPFDLFNQIYISFSLWVIKKINNKTAYIHTYKILTHTHTCTNILTKLRTNTHSHVPNIPPIYTHKKNLYPHPHAYKISTRRCIHINYPHIQNTRTHKEYPHGWKTMAKIHLHTGVKKKL